jgi:general nucleoside transport system ATP-binding protein
VTIEATEVAGGGPDEARHRPLAVECRGVTRRYAGVVANDQIDFQVAEGEIHALVGENGAGKSTLMKMLYGLEQPDEGEILVRGQPEKIDSPRRAIALRIGMVHQHFMLVDAFTVAENVVLGSEPSQGGRLDIDEAERRVGELARGFGTPLDPRARVEDLTVGQEQRVEILKLLYRGADILILDEPTAVLVPQEVEELFANLRQLKAQGKTIIFIAHSLDEVLQVADRITVLRDGKVIGTVNAADTTSEQVAEMMVGRPVLLRRVEGTEPSGEPMLQVKDLRVVVGGKERVAGLDLDVRRSEIYGLAGVEGNGQAELVEALVGLRRPDTGRIYLGDDELTNADVRTRRQHGIAYIPEDRQARGMVLQMLVTENSVLGQHERQPFSRRGLLDLGAIRRRAVELVRNFRVKAPSVAAPAYALSGGNQQKLVLGREFASKPKLLIAAHPTRGLDIGATEFVWRELVLARDAGVAVLLISANLEEILALADRVGVIHDGRLVVQLPGSEATMSELGLYMTGARSGSEGIGGPAGDPPADPEPAA